MRDTNRIVVATFIPQSFHVIHSSSVLLLRPRAYFVSRFNVVHFNRLNFGCVCLLIYLCIEFFFTFMPFVVYAVATVVVILRCGL